MSYFVYLIATNRKNKIITYVGYTKNLLKRLSLHNLGKGAKFTRGKKWKLIYSKIYYDKSQAIKEEFKLKKNYAKRNILKNEFLIKDEFN